MPRCERDGCWLYGAQYEGFHVQRVGHCIKEEKSKTASESRQGERNAYIGGTNAKENAVRFRSIHSS